MRIARIRIKNFRGVREGELLLPSHAVLVGDNNIGKSTVLEAIDLVLGPERLKRTPVVDEHDFYAGEYITKADAAPISIDIEVLIVALSDDQKRVFRDHLEWWKEAEKVLLTEPPPEGTDAPGVEAALRVSFHGAYDADEDDFKGSTFFAWPDKEDGSRDPFKFGDKRLCGFLILRALRTGTRALSLERGSLLDIILSLKGKQLTMWEDILEQLRVLPVAEKPEIGITDILSGVQAAVREFVPAEWASNPHMRVSDLTRENLRKALTVFMDTGATRGDGTAYAAPFRHQGTGTINTLVLAMLSLIAELKASVIFAMEEPEVAIPPHAQKRIVDSVRAKSAQALFTSHSPYVLEEFPPEQIVVLQRVDGNLSGVQASLPPAVKPKKYKEEFRKRFCEMLLARRVLITEGRTEYDAIPAACRQLSRVEPAAFRSLEGLGIAVLNAETDSQIAPLAEYCRALGKTVFAMYDAQVEPQKSEIVAAAHHAYESPHHSFEQLLVDQTVEAGLRRFAHAVVAGGDWPPHLAAQTPHAGTTLADLRNALRDYFKWSKGEGTAADLLEQCAKAEMPTYIVESLRSIDQICAAEEVPPVAQPVPGGMAAAEPAMAGAAAPATGNPPAQT